MSEEVSLSDPAALQRTVDSLLAVGQVERARELVMQFIASDPANPFGHLSLSRVLQAAGQLVQSLETVEQALARAPDDDQAHLQRAGLLLELGRYREAEESVRRSIELDPAWGPSHAMYASILSVCDRDVEALQRAEHALSLMPNAAWLHRMRARLLMFVHPRHWTLSEDAVRTSLRLNPESSQAHAVLGLVLMRGGRNEEAEEAFRASLRLDPNEPLALRGLSELVKGSSPLYRPMLWLGQLMSRLGPDGQLGVLFGLWAVYAGARALIAPGNQSAADLLTATYFGLCAYTWFAEPITRALLRRTYPWLT